MALVLLDPPPADAFKVLFVMERFAPRSRGTTAPVLVPYQSELVTFEFVTAPGNVAVIPDRPIVIPVAEFVPMEIVPVASMILFESPVIPVPLNMSAAKAAGAILIERERESGYERGTKDGFGGYRFH